ncbi:MAG: DUF6497 family protein [Roseovarius sp.]|nr:DUF6497 family protein [Roseovarius sp.]
MRARAWRRLTAGGVPVLVASSGAEAAEPGRVTLPSGLVAVLQETIREDGPVMRYRYVADGFDSGAPLAQVAADLEHLCAADAAPRAAAAGLEAARLVISLADRASEFGRADPQLRQVFEAFRLENGTCIWEAF